MQREELPDLVTVGSSFELRVIRSPEQDAPHAASRVFYCFCREPCKVGLTKRIESPNRGRCFLTCAQQNAQREGCQFFQWIDEAWGPRNNDLQMCMSKGQ